MLDSKIAMAVCAALAVTLAGCATSSPDVISRNDAQRMSSVIDATGDGACATLAAVHRD